jgi:superfamily II DNA helicase RecQ
MRRVLTAADPEVSARLTRLRQALARSRAVWGGCPLEPEVLLRLAKHPPTNAAALADVPGVGAALAERLGGTILGALSAGRLVAEVKLKDSALLASLEEWRAGLAGQMGVPPYAVIPNAVLSAIAESCPRSRLDLARVRGVGPRTLAKFGDDLLQLVAEPECPAQVIHPIVPPPK